MHATRWFAPILAIAVFLGGCAGGQAEYASTPVAAGSLSAGMSTVADFHAPDGKTTGSIRVTLVDSTTDPESLDAELEFIDFSSSHDQLTVGGSFEPRGDGECFAFGGAPEPLLALAEPESLVRAGAGMFNPQSFDVETDIGRLPATLQPATNFGLYEVVLHDSTGCERILASAALDLAG